MLGKKQEKSVFMVDAGGKVRSAITSEPSNIGTGMLARLVHAVTIESVTLPVGTLGTLVFVDPDTGDLYLDFNGEVVVLMPFECDHWLLDAIRLHWRLTAALAAG